MHFITCFDENWLENQRRFFGFVECPRDDGKAVYLSSHTRTFGYFVELERALQAVRRNEMDLHECLYTWCVVEHLPEGIHPMGADLDALGSNEHWFRWDYELRAWQSTSRPAELERVCGGFALG